MKGRITKIWQNPSGWGFIKGEDGVDYYFHHSDFINRNAKIRKDYIVEFDIGSNPVTGEPAAKNIRKIGHGSHHPLARSIQRIGDVILEYVPDDYEDKQYILQDLNTIYNYFCKVADCDQFSNPQQECK